MAMIVDAVFGAALGELLKSVLEMKHKAAKFRPTLLRLENILKSVHPLAKQIDDLNRKLGRPTEESERLIDLMKSGKEVVLNCSNVNKLNCYKQANKQEDLEDLIQSIRDHFDFYMQIQVYRSTLEIQVRQNETIGIQANVEDNVLIHERVELMGVCQPPDPPISLDISTDVNQNVLPQAQADRSGLET